MRISSRLYLIVLLGLALIAGCSGMRVGYRHADTFLAWRADQYFDFDTRQKGDFNQRVDRLLAWHRYEQLPDYAAFINTAVKKAQPGLKREDIVWFIDGVAARYRVVVRHGTADAAEVLATLKPEQIAALQKQWDKDNQRFVREHALNGTLAERKTARQKRMLDQIEDWTGNLGTEQEQKIAALIDTMPHVNHLRQQDRIRRQKEFLELLKQRADKQEFQSRLQTWMSDWDRGRSAEYARLADEVYEKRMQFYIAVDKLLTPEQRHTVLHKLQELAEDFNSLSKKPVKAASYTHDIAMLAWLCAPGPHACIPE